MTKWISTGVVLCGLLAGASLQAHHSLAGMYSLGKEAKVTGAFKAFRLVNPHSSLKVEVKGQDGSIVEWSFLGGSVQQLARLDRQDRTERPEGRRMKSPSRACRQRTARARLACCQRSHTRTATRFVSGRPDE